jgi:hypothetical protein
MRFYMTLPTLDTGRRAASREPSTSAQDVPSERREESSSSAAPANTTRKCDRALRRNGRNGGSESSEGRL